MKKSSMIALAALAGLVFSLQTTWAQIPTRLPRVPGVERPKQEQPRTDDSPAEARDTAPAHSESKSTSANSQRLYETPKPPNKPVLIKDSLYIQAKTQDMYWKFPNQQNYSSWAPTVKFFVFFNGSGDLSYRAEYFNPDGSNWFSEDLEVPGPIYTYETSSISTYLVQSKYGNTSKLLDTKSSAATGTYGIKIANPATGEVVFQGKFKVDKFHKPYSEQYKNKFEFFVDHDWLLPIGYVGFASTESFTTGAVTPTVSMWLKNKVEANELEARLFYKGQQIGTTANRGGTVVDDGTNERATEMSALSADLHYWKRWEFTWFTFRYDNGGSYNPDNYPNTTYGDNNPGDYTVKVYRNGVQIREAKFTVGTDRRLLDAGYARQSFFLGYNVITPVKVVGNAEKWNALSWKTDAFYGNPLPGFSAP